MTNIKRFAAGETQFKFKKDVYGCDEARDRLKSSQSGKCCYCEKRMTDWPKDVEHYRPKAAVNVTGSKRLKRPGYYWLAYDWDNLMLACNSCNGSNKRNQFPLVSEASRANGADRDTSDEEPLLLNPIKDDPQKYIGFRDEYPFSIKGDIRGKTTITVCGLDREPLNELRRDHLLVVDTLVKVAQLHKGEKLGDAAALELKKHLSEEGQFWSCVQSYLNKTYGTANVDQLLY